MSRAETVGIIITAVGLTDSSGAALSDNSLIQVIANTAGQTPGAPTVTSFVSGSDIVLTSFGLDSSSTGIPGSFQVYLTIDRSAFAGLNPGAPLLLRWYDIPYSSGLTAPGFSAFGQFTTNVVVDDSTSGWTLGQDGSNSSLNFINTANGGSQSSTAGAAGNMVSRNLLTLTANSGQTKVYGANDPTLTYSITSGSLVGSDVITGAPARDSGSAVGQYAITQGSLTAGNNYTITFVSNNFTITPQLLGVAANTGQGKIYGATDPSPLAYTITSGALIGSDTLSGQLQRAAGESAGNYAITQGTLAASSNYTLTYTGANFTISKAPLIVTANPQSRPYNTENPPLTLSYSGFVFNDTANSLTTQPTATTSANLSSPIGSYPITASGGISSNYTFTYINGALVVIKSSANVSLSGLAHTYTGNPQGAIASAVGGLPVTLTYNGSATVPSAPGTYTVVATINDANYQGTVTGTLTIGKAPQTITFAALSDRDPTSAPFVLNATATSGLPVTFALVGPATLIGDTVTLIGTPGTVMITASQAGDSDYLPAADVSETFSVVAPPSDHLINLSSRARVSGNGERSLISGFIIGGAQPKRVLLRAIGPSLASLGVSDPLANPRLRLYDGSGHVLLENDDWSGTETSDAMAQTGAFSLPVGSHDAAVVTTLPPGAYTMLILNGGQTGTVLAEVYDASAQSAAQSERLVNISSRGMVESNGGPVIGGFIITGTLPKKVLIRGAGPSLTAYGVINVLADPKLKVYDGSGMVIAQNDDWGTPIVVSADQTAATPSEIAAAAQATGAFAFAPGSKDAAVVVTLPPGAHTAVVSGPPGTSGVALVEIYEVP